MGHHRYHLAMDGDTWNAIQMHYSELIPNIVARGTIFARFRPEQKSQIVLCLQKYDYIVAMCGDGANDCGALRVSLFFLICVKCPGVNSFFINFRIFR